MAHPYYKPCAELTRCNDLIERYWETKQYEKCFAGHMELAQKGYPLAECQIGYFYLHGFGVEKDWKQAFYWTERAAKHGDWDAQYNLASFYEQGVATAPDLEKADYWYRKAAAQGHKLALQKIGEEQPAEKSQKSD